MDDPGMDPLPPELDALVVAERRLDAGDAAMKGRVLRRLEEALQTPDPGDGWPGRAGQAGSPADGSPTDGSPAAPAAAAARAGGAKALSVGLGASIAAAVAAFVVGVGVGGFVAKSPPAVFPATTIVVQVSVPPSFDTAPAKAPAAAADVDRAAIAPVRGEPPDRAERSGDSDGPAKSAASVAPKRSGPSDLAAERELIDVARAALSRGRPGVALDVLARHAREFPKGQLAEERQALRIQALAAAGRTDEARSQADGFRKSHPDSMLLQSVEAAVDGAP